MNKMKSNLSRFFPLKPTVFPAHVLLVFLGALLLGFDGLTADAHAADRGERIEVEGEGEAVIVKQDFLGARNKALDMAKRAALSRAIEEAAPAPMALSRQHELVNELAPRINEFLVQYRFEEMPLAGTVFVTVQAVFSRSGIRDEFQRRGLFRSEGAVDRIPEEIFLVMHGIRSPQTYLDIVEQLPRKVGGFNPLFRSRSSGIN